MESVTCVNTGKKNPRRKRVSSSMVREECQEHIGTGKTNSFRVRYVNRIKVATVRDHFVQARLLED